ncbi:MAG: hypothetical protein Ct9H300mP11_12530 [Chloroflexota bacterium]|nr:MAG: hypothetical protein Ct9H300mP11_12530 [Chloroflexota bacterium]
MLPKESPRAVAVNSPTHHRRYEDRSYGPSAHGSSYQCTAPTEFLLIGDKNIARIETEGAILAKTVVPAANTTTHP